MKQKEEKKVEKIRNAETITPSRRVLVNAFF
jgi:hypothetical protein